MKAHLSRLSSANVIAVSIFLTSCTGVLDGSSPGSGADGHGLQSGPGPSATSAAGGTAPLDCSGQHPSSSAIRRLNRFEYNNTAHDLLGDTSGPANDFPTEERSHLGLDNDSSRLGVSPVLIEQYQLAAEKLAENAVANLPSLLPCDPVQVGEPACAESFIQTFGAKAFRRPIAADELARLTKVFTVGQSSGGFSVGIRMIIETLLQSPAFLYRVELDTTPSPAGSVVRPNSWEMASRLAYTLWQSMPDQELSAAAARDGLQNSADIAAQVQRMLGDPRAHAMVSHFHEVWLHLDKLATLEKDPQVFPDLTQEISGLMAQETRQFLDHVVWQGEGSVGALFTAPYTFMNAKLAAYYGVSGPSGTELSQVQLDPSKRLGFLTQGGILAMLAKANQTGPVQRGKFVREQLLCMQMPPPPAGVVIKVPDVSQTLSARERFSAHSKDPTCAGCHTLMDPIGLALENFDGAGRYRESENGKPIDASGEIFQSDVTGGFVGAAGLAQKLAQSKAVKACMARAWFEYGFGREQSDEDSCAMAQINQKFESSGYQIKALITALTESDPFLYRKAIGGAP